MPTGDWRGIIDWMPCGRICWRCPEIERRQLSIEQSDFDGADMPEGMEDCSKLPKITEALLRKGYSEDDIRKILGENTLRVMAQAERVAKEMGSKDAAK